MANTGQKTQYREKTKTSNKIIHSKKYLSCEKLKWFDINTRAEAYFPSITAVLMHTQAHHTPGQARGEQGP